MERPEEMDIIGLYQMTFQNINGSEEFQNRQPEILINADGSCKVTDFPVWQPNSRSYFVKEWLSFEGTWKIKKFGSVRKDGENYDNWGMSCSDKLEKIGIGGEFVNNEPPYDILFIYDDPDTGIVMTFQKSP